MSTLVFYNYKGGVGKTTMSVLAADHLSRSGKRILLIDFDPQRNATQFLEASYGEIKTRQSVEEALKKNSLDKSIVKLDNKLDVIPGSWKLSLWPSSLEKVPQMSRHTILKQAISRVKSNYDYVIVDVPPTTSEFTHNAVFAADYVVIPVPAQRSGYNALKDSINYLTGLKKDFGLTFKVSGFVLYLVAKSNRTNQTIAKELRDNFGRSVFSNEIYNRDRVTRWSDKGITHKKTDTHDKKTHEMYSLVFHEMLYRMGDED